MLPSDRYATQIALPPTDIVANRTRRSSLVLVSHASGKALPCDSRTLFSSQACFVVSRFRSINQSPDWAAACAQQPTLRNGCATRSTPLDLATMTAFRQSANCARHWARRPTTSARLWPKSKHRGARQHVGKGTFVRSRPVLNVQDVTYPGDQTKPTQVGQSPYLNSRLPKFGQIHASALVDCFDMTDSSASPAVAWRFG